MHSSKKRQFLPHYWSDKGFIGNVVDWVLQSLHKGFFEIALTVPLNVKIWRF